MTMHRPAAMASAIAVLIIFGPHTLRSRAQADEGGRLYEHKCAICHKQGGMGATTLARRLGVDKSDLAARTDLPGNYVRQVVRSGIGGMPYFTKVDLTDDELNAVAEYLSGRTDQRK